MNAGAKVGEFRRERGQKIILILIMRTHFPKEKESNFEKINQLTDYQ